MVILFSKIVNWDLPSKRYVKRFSFFQRLFSVYIVNYLTVLTSQTAFQNWKYHFYLCSSKEIDCFCPNENVGMDFITRFSSMTKFCIVS